MGFFCAGISRKDLTQLKSALGLSNLINSMDKFWGKGELLEVAKGSVYTNAIKVVFNELIKWHSCKNGTKIIDAVIL